MSERHKVIAVDLDGTLAHYNGDRSPTIGEPIPLMVERVKGWLSEGHTVKIFTSRMGTGDPEKTGKAFVAIAEWSRKHLGTVLPITAFKEPTFAEIWDDRAVTVERNTGRVLTTKSNG